MNGLVLQRRSQSHVHECFDLLEHHIPTTWIVQDFTVFVDLFLKTKLNVTTHGAYTAGIWNINSFLAAIYNALYLHH